MTFEDWINKEYPHLANIDGAFYETDMEEAWNAALEQAAKVCKERLYALPDTAIQVGYNAAIEDCEYKIKALMGIDDE